MIHFENSNMFILEKAFFKSENASFKPENIIFIEPRTNILILGEILKIVLIYPWRIVFNL